MKHIITPIVKGTTFAKSEKNNIMSKKNRILTLISTFVLLFTISSCVNSDDYDIPDVTVSAVDPSVLGSKTNFNNVIATHTNAVDANNDGQISQDEEENADNVVGTFEFDGDLYIEGYVVSSDRDGNFFEELIIQNSPNADDAGTDPRRGLNIQINASSLSDVYELGRKVYVKLNGLAIGIENGVYTLGRAVGNSLDQIQSYEYKYDPTQDFPTFILRDSAVVDITPKIAAIGDLTEADENTFIQLDNMQINRNELGLDFAGQPSDEFDGFRTLESCNDATTIKLQTSTFADFKSVTLPEGSGAISGIYTRDFGDDISVLVLNGLSDITFNNPERCDPAILECDGPTSAAATLFEEDFQLITNENQLDALGWTNVNVSGGSERYEDSAFSGDRYMKISAFGTGENPLEAWLVTPAINLDSTTQEELSFEVSSNFETGRILTAFISNAYTGDPTTTEWTQLDVEIPIGDGGFGDFVTLTANISCLDGDVNVAFKYLGAAGGAETRYHIDDIKVTGSN